jgi:hypothetical protein
MAKAVLRVITPEAAWHVEDTTAYEHTMMLRYLQLPAHLQEIVEMIELLRAARKNLQGLAGDAPTAWGLHLLAMAKQLHGNCIANAAERY